MALDPDLSWPCASSSRSKKRLPSGRVAAIASKALTHLYRGKIPFVWYMQRDLGYVHKILRGVARPEIPPDDVHGVAVEKPWIAGPGATVAFNASTPPRANSLRQRRTVSPLRPPRTISESRCAGVRRVELGASGFRIEANTCIPDGMIDEDAIRYRWEAIGRRFRRDLKAGFVRA